MVCFNHAFTFHTNNNIVNECWWITCKSCKRLPEICHSRKCIWKYCLRNGGHFVPGEFSSRFFHPCSSLTAILKDLHYLICMANLLTVRYLLTNGQLTISSPKSPFRAMGRGFNKGKRYTETERSSRWLICSSLEMLKVSFNVPSEDQSSHPGELSVSVLFPLDIPHSLSKRTETAPKSWLYDRINSVTTEKKEEVKRFQFDRSYPDNNFHGAHMGPTWVLSAPDGSHVGPMNLAIRVIIVNMF